MVKQWLWMLFYMKFAFIVILHDWQIDYNVSRIDLVSYRGC